MKPRRHRLLTGFWVLLLVFLVAFQPLVPAIPRGIGPAQANASNAGNGHDFDFGSANNGIRTIKALTDSANQVHLLGAHYGWYAYGATVWEFVRGAGPSGTWSAKLMASHIHADPVDAGSTYHENAIMGPSDKITVFSHNTSANGSTHPNRDTVYHFDRVSGIWGATATVDQVSTDWVQPTVLAYGGLNALHAAYQGSDGQTIYHRQDWGVREPIFTAPAGFKIGSADMLGDAVGNLKLIHNLREIATDKYGEIYVREKPAGGSWGPASAVTSFGPGHEVVGPHFGRKIGTPSLNSPRLVYANITSRSPGWSGQIYFQDLAGLPPTPTPYYGAGAPTGDGIVDIFDLVIAGLNFGKAVPVPTASPSPFPILITAATPYSANNCGLCHGANRQGGLGPPLTAAALAGKTVDQVANTIANGSGTMPAFSSALTAAQVDSLANWLKTAPAPTPTVNPTPTPFATAVPSPSPFAINAASLYSANSCDGCHGVMRQGGFGPPLTVTALAGRSVQEIASTIANGRNAMPGFSGVSTAAQIDALANWLKAAP